MVKRSLSTAVLAVIITCAVAGTCLAAVPPDVEGLSCEESVAELLKLEIVKGYEDGSFRPQKEISRAEFTKTMIMMLGLGDAVKLYPDESRFLDLGKDHWAAGYINLAVEQGFIDGYPDGNFRPDHQIGCAEALKILISILGYFPDNNQQWPYNYISKASQLQIVSDMEIASPDAGICRGDAAVLIYKALSVPVVNGDASCTLQNRLLVRSRETDHFIFYCIPADINILDEIAEKLEKGCGRVASDLGCVLENKVVVKIYPDLYTFHAAVGSPDAPDWAIGRAKNGKIHIVSPLNPGPVHNADSVLNSVVHEFTHIMERKINPGYLPVWLNEGVAYYEGQNYGDIKTLLSDDINKGNIPTLDELDNRDVFGPMKGGEWSATIVAMIISEYGYDSLQKLITNPADFDRALGINEEEFYRRWLSFLSEHYK